MSCVVLDIMYNCSAMSWLGQTQGVVPYMSPVEVFVTIGSRMESSNKGDLCSVKKKKNKNL